MPFVSKKQARFMFSQKPAMAKEFAAATPSIKALPERAKGTALMNARKRRRARPRALSGPPKAFGQRIEGASTSTSRVGY